MVLKHDDRLELGLVTGLHEGGLSDDGGSLFRVAVRILEQSCTETVHQQAHCRGLEALAGALLAVFVHPHLIGLEYGALVVVAAELVDAGLDDLEVALGHAEEFVAPGLALEGKDAGIVVGDVPVGADHSVEAVLVAEQVGDDVFAVTVTVVGSGRGELVPDERIEAKKAMLDIYPNLRGMYDENDGNTIVLYCRNACATISSFSAAPRFFEL